jgi:hypothetical protein
MRQEPYLPARLGFDALAELDSVDWSELDHAYGTGVVGDEIFGDVARSLALVSSDASTAVDMGLYSNVCHQGTVYEASAFAVPFIAAIAAGDIPSDVRSMLLHLVGDIAIGGSFVAPSGSYAGSFGDDVHRLVSESIIRSESYFAAIERVDPALAPLVTAIRRVANDPSDPHREAVLAIIDPDGPNSSGESAATP